MHFVVDWTQFGPRNGSVLAVIDTDPHSIAKGGAFDNTRYVYLPWFCLLVRISECFCHIPNLTYHSLVPKYTLTTEQYRARENTYYAYKKKQQELDPAWRNVFSQRNAEAQQLRRQAALAEVLLNQPIAQIYVMCVSIINFCGPRII